MILILKLRNHGRITLRRARQDIRMFQATQTHLHRRNSSNLILLNPNLSTRPNPKNNAMSATKSRSKLLYIQSKRK